MDVVISLKYQSCAGYEGCANKGGVQMSCQEVPKRGRDGQCRGLVGHGPLRHAYSWMHRRQSMYESSDEVETATRL